MLAEDLKDQIDQTANPESVYFTVLMHESQSDQKIVDFEQTEVRRMTHHGDWFGFVMRDGSVLSHYEGCWIAQNPVVL